MTIKHASRYGMLLILLLMIAGTLHSPLVFAEDKKEEKLADKVKKLENELEKLKAKEESYDYLKEENRQYREFVEKEWDRFLELFMWFTGGIGAVLIFFNISSKREIKSTLEEQMVQAKIELGKTREKIHEETVQELNSVRQDTRKMAEQEFKGVLKKELSILKRDVTSLQEIAQRESWVQSAKIHVFDHGRVATLVSSIFRDKEVDITCESHNPISDFEDRKSDIIVYDYKPEIKDEEDRLVKLVEHLKTLKERTIPIVIYYTGPDQINNKSILSYKWRLFANTDISLITQISSLSHVFSSRDEKEEGGERKGA